jgi:hypothetical protein
VTTFSPLGGEEGAGRRANITITFNEAVRKLDDSELTDSDLNALITLRENNPSVTITKVATINSDKTIITIDPDPRLESEWFFYVAIDDVEDSLGNAITASSATFKTCKSCD